MTTEEEGVLARLDWAHEGVEISKVIRKLRAEGPFVPPRNYTAVCVAVQPPNAPVWHRQETDMTTDNELVAEAVEALRPAVLSAALTPANMALVTGMVVDMTLVIAPRIAAIFEGFEADTPEEASFQIQVKLWADAVSLLAMPVPSL